MDSFVDFSFFSTERVFSCAVFVSVSFLDGRIFVFFCSEASATCISCVSMMLLIAIFFILCVPICAMGGGFIYSVWFLVIAAVCLIVRRYGMKMMHVIIYWDNGMVFYDKDGNEIVQLPRQAIEQMSGNNRKITIPWNGVEYKIVRNPFDNEKEVQEMLAFYGKDR